MFVLSEKIANDEKFFYDEKYEASEAALFCMAFICGLSEQGKRCLRGFLLFILAHLTIPKNLSAIICKDNALLKPLTVFYQLKSLYVGGSIHRIRSRYKEIADKFGISMSKLKYCLKWLYSNGYAEIKGHELRLISNRKVKELFDIPTNKKDTIPFDTSDNTETRIKALSVQQGLKQQEYKIKEKILTYYGTGIKSPKYKKWQIDVMLHKLKRGGIGRKRINPQVTYSRLGLAKVLGRTSRTSGLRFISKLKKIMDVIDTVNYQFILKCTYEVSYWFKINNPTVKGLLWKNGWLVKQLPNTIVIKGL